MNDFYRLVAVLVAIPNFAQRRPRQPKPRTALFDAPGDQDILRAGNEERIAGSKRPRRQVREKGRLPITAGQTERRDFDARSEGRLEKAPLERSEVRIGHLSVQKPTSGRINLVKLVSAKHAQCKRICNTRPHVLRHVGLFQDTATVQAPDRVVRLRT